MTTYNTGNPIGSTAVKDLYDNAENLDVLVNNKTKASHPDRLGVARKTWHGMEKEFSEAQEFRVNSFNADQDDRDDRFNAFITSSGYQFLGDYAADIEITEYNQLVRDADGEFWRLSGEVELPYTTTGAGLPENDSLVPLGDAVLRQELANPDLGARLVAYRHGETVQDRLDLLSREPSENDNFYPHSASAIRLPMSDQLFEGDGRMLDGQAVHPSVEYVPEGLGPQGFKYWMAITPYQFTNDRTENPCVYASYDAISWVIPDGLTNPVYGPPPSPTSHCSDTEIIYHNGQLWMFFRETEKSTSPSYNKILLTKSTDGVNWSAPTVIVEGAELIASPTVVYYEGTFKLWLVSGGGSRLQLYESVDGETWAHQRQVSLNEDWPSDVSTWHIHAIRNNNRYEMLINTSSPSRSRDIWFATSDDGNGFTVHNLVMSPVYYYEVEPDRPFSRGLYRACMVPSSSQSDEYLVWYSAQRGNHWTSYVTACKLVDDKLQAVSDVNNPLVSFGSIFAPSASFGSLTVGEGIADTGLTVAGVGEPIAASTNYDRGIIASARSSVSGRLSIAAATSNCDVESVNSFSAASDNVVLSSLSSSSLSAIHSTVGTGSNAASIIASRGCGILPSSPYSLLAASRNSYVSGNNSFVIGSLHANVNGGASGAIASDRSETNSNYSSVISSVESTTGAHSTYASVISSNRCEVLDNSIGASILGSLDSTASGARAFVHSSSQSDANGAASGIIAGDRCVSSTYQAVVVAGIAVENNSPNTIAMGWAPTGNRTPSTQNQRILLDGRYGWLYASNTSILGLDYAELFENGEGVEIPPGTLVTLRGVEVFTASEGDFVLGVVSHTHGVLGGDYATAWQGRYLADEWGRVLKDEEGNPIENPEYDSSKQYTPRSERPNEWTPVGLLGQVRVRVDSTVDVNDWVKPTSNGIGTKSENETNLRCMDILTAKEDYSIAICLIK